MSEDLKRLLANYREGKLSLHEEILLSKRLGNQFDGEADKFLFDDLREHFGNEQAEPKELKGVLNAIHHRIRLNESARQRNNLHKLYQTLSKVAAILFLPLLLVALYQWYSGRSSEGQLATTEIVAPKGARVRFQLPDGTSGTLNSTSSLVYSSTFLENRQVTLIGEAYFDVAKDVEHPFTISANNNQIRVVGTKFSLSAYPDDEETELVLEEGKVVFTPYYSDKQKIEVVPGEHLICVNGKVTQTEVETWKYTAWKDGKLIFRNDSMDELARRISRWYDVDVEIDDKGLEEYVFRGVFENDPLDEVLRLLQKTSPISYTIIDRQLNADGTYSKRHVIINKK